MSDHGRLQVAKAVAEKAGARALEHYRGLAQLEVEEKGIQDYVTEADRDVEALIRQSLSEAFPEDGFIGEELGRTPSKPGGGHWVVDPIDGTANFIRGFPWFGVSIAWVHDGRPQVAAIHDCTRNDLYWAARGEGAFCHGTKLSVSATTEAERSALCLGLWGRGESDRFVRAMEAAVAGRCDVRRLGAACLALAYCARGAFDGFWQVKIWPWDVAAGALLVEEAGGFVSPFFEHGGLDDPQPFLAATPGMAQTFSQWVQLEADHRPGRS